MTTNETPLAYPWSESEIALQRQLWAEVIREYEKVYGKRERSNTCTENLYEKCDGTKPADITFDHYGVPTEMCEDCYEWLHGRLDPIKRG